MKYPTAKQYISLSNAGAHFATQSNDDDPDRKVLQALMKCKTSPRLADFLSLIKAFSSKPSLQHTMSLFSQGYLKAEDEIQVISNKNLELCLPQALKELSDSQHCAIADKEGFLISHSGFVLEQAEQAALLAVEISGLQEKRLRNLQGLCDQNNSSISIIDNQGQSQLRFWPIYFNQQVFFLAIKGKPLLENASFNQLVWLLGQRYL